MNKFLQIQYSTLNKTISFINNNLFQNSVNTPLKQYITMFDKFDLVEQLYQV